MIRIDLEQIIRWIPEGARVLDLGCGDGAFLATLRERLQVQGTGIEIDPDNLEEAVARGLDVIQQDIDAGLCNFASQSYDVVVMAHALQVLANPDVVLKRMVDIGQETIITFPNFAHWRCRFYLAVKGRMPVSRILPYSWYDTPNIHFCTVKDFEALCASLDIQIIDKDMVGASGRSWLATLWPNLFAVTAIYRLRQRR